MKEFLDLPEDKFQKDIIVDLEAKKEAGMSEEEIMKRLHFLVKYGHYLSMVDGTHSDEDYYQKLSEEELKLMGEIGGHLSGFDDYVERMEETIRSEESKKIN